MRSFENVQSLFRFREGENFNRRDMFPGLKSELGLPVDGGHGNWARQNVV